MPHRLRNRHLLALDAILVTASSLVAYLVRFEGWDFGPLHAHTAPVYIALATPLRLTIYFLAGLYRGLWRHASVVELERIAIGGAAASLACIAYGALLVPGLGLADGRVPLSVLALDASLSIIAVAAPRLLMRVFGTRGLRRRAGDTRVLIAGAGTAGQAVVKELLAHPDLGMYPVGFVDDDRNKHHHSLSGLQVFGAIADLPRIAKRLGVRTLIIAMPSARGQTVREIVRLADAANVETRIIPGLSEILSGRADVSTIREVQIEDLLRREPIQTNLDDVRALATGRTVLVTGAGGSIGSELSRQLALVAPDTLVALGHGENSIFEIERVLRESYPHVRVVPVIADTRDRARLQAIFQTYRPHAVFHAAAHKHVPLMEANVAEAVTNNVQGTLNVVEAALDAGTPHFVLISTDKAVRPTSVMGATKRVAELVVQTAAQMHGRRYVAVRFGNVLGSRGSVVPTFLRQIRAGGPVTVTNAEMKRFFMTIPEAVQLVLQAGALGHGGEVFVLDMGEPVRIVDLAADLIRLSGLQVGTDIEIRFTGTRPGEKLSEEIFFRGEHVAPTHHPKVLRARHVAAPERAAEQIQELVAVAQAGGSDYELLRMLEQLVPDYTAPRAVDEQGDEISGEARALPLAIPLTGLADRVPAPERLEIPPLPAMPIEGPRRSKETTPLA